MQDIFICGVCQASYHELDQFVVHKQSPCQPVSAVGDENSGQSTDQGQGHYQQSTDQGQGQYQQSADQGQQVGHYQQSNNDGGSQYSQSITDQGQGHYSQSNDQGQGQYPQSTDQGQDQYQQSNDQGQGQYQPTIDPGGIMDQITTEQIREQVAASQEQQNYGVQGQSFAIQGQGYENQGQNFQGQGQDFVNQNQQQFNAANQNYEVDFGEGNLQVALNEGGVLSMVEDGMDAAANNGSTDGKAGADDPGVGGQLHQMISIVDHSMIDQADALVPKIYQLQPLEGGGFELLPRPDLPVSTNRSEDTAAPAQEKEDVFLEPLPVKVKKKIGRPRRGEEKNKRSPPKKEQGRLPLPERSADGKYHCQRCQHSFNRDRHYNSHKCFANSIYADISKNVPGEDLEDETPDEEDDEIRSEYSPDESLTVNVKKADASYNANSNNSNSSSAQRKSATVLPTNVGEGLRKVGDNAAATLPLLNGDGSDVNDVGVIVEPIPRGKKRSRGQPKEIAEIAFSEEEKLGFDRALNVDLTGLDHMYKEHFIDQDVNQFAPVPLNHRDAHLSIFSCNTCDKVFKSMSQMRQHCLIHTSLRPYQCPKCEYCTNSKGNLYTHMKKHLGWYFNCSKCAFKTVNRSHFVEHEAIHENQKTKCPVCKKNYSTQKSLINHLRKYHPDRVEDYCKKPRSIVGQAILHQCEICNRKFKKKIDRDRHLFMHNIITSERTYECVLCDYSSHKKNLLEKHLWKHRFIYQCTLCPLKFLSATKLRVHLDSEHGSLNTKLFEDCIGKSLYLPEPDGSIEPLKPNLQNIDEQCRKLLLDFEKGLNPQEIPLNPQEKEKNVFEPMELPENLPNDAIADPEALTEAIDQAPSEDSRSESNETTAVNVNPLTPAVPDIPEVHEPQEEEAPRSMDPDAILDTRDSECWDIITRMGYLVLSVEIYDKIRESFGESECEHCGNRFWKIEDHNKHLLTHTNLRLYPCDECSYKSESKEYLRRHIARYHMFESTYSCDTCAFKSSDKADFWKHKMSHHKKPEKEIDCPRCRSKFDSRGLALHIAVQHPDLSREEIVKLTGVQLKILGKMGQRTFQCSHCNTVLRTSADLRKHLTEAHDVAKQYGCQYCSYTSNNIHGLKSHLVRHSTVKPYVCEVCHRSYKSRTAARWHARTHQFGRLFKCDKCSYEAIQKTHLVRHMETHLVRKRYRCHICDYSSNTSGYLRVHYTRTHKGEEPPQYALAPPRDDEELLPTRVYKCEACDFVFGNLYDIRRHMKTKHRVAEDLVQFSTPESELQGPPDVQAQTSFNNLPSIYPDKSGDDVHPGLDMSVQEMDHATPMDEATPIDDAKQEHAGQQLVAPIALDQKAASAVSLLQELVGLQPGVLAPGQALQVQSMDGQILVVQQHGDDIIISTPDQSEIGNQHYVITYVNDQQQAGPDVDSTNQLLNFDSVDSASDAMEFTNSDVNEMEDSLETDLSNNDI